jgi:hypothetical protein
MEDRVSDEGRNAAQAELERFIGEWTMEIDFPGLARIDAGTRVSFEWSPGGWFLVERWQIPVPEFPDGAAVIGWDDGRQTLLQHYFDSRGVARVYEMRMENAVWTLIRTEPDFSPLDFEQRFIGELSDDGRTITGRWEAKHSGKDWEVDFRITYRRRS